MVKYLCLLITDTDVVFTVFYGVMDKLVDEDELEWSRYIVHTVYAVHRVEEMNGKNGKTHTLTHTDYEYADVHSLWKAQDFDSGSNSGWKCYG